MKIRINPRAIARLAVEEYFNCHEEEIIDDVQEAILSELILHEQIEAAISGYAEEIANTLEIESYIREEVTNMMDSMTEVNE